MSTIGRLPPSAPQLPVKRPAGPEAARQAQAAFFAAASGQTPQPQATAPAVSTTPASAVEPTRYPRPGSLLDIKV
jgi:hypothetical protein